MKNTAIVTHICKLSFLLFSAASFTAWGQSTTPPTPDSPTAACGGNAEDYIVGIAEEFNAPLDPNIWLDRFGFIPPTPVIGYEVTNGFLRLWLQRDETDPLRSFAPRVIYSNPVTPIGGNPARTGYVQRYGCFEMEAKLPFGKGLFPAFWLMTVPGLPEIDIMETYMRDDYADAQLHPISYEVATHVACTPADPVAECSPTTGARAVDSKITFTNVDLSAGFHRYAAKWEPNQITFYLDGNPVHTTAVSFADQMYIGVGILVDPRSPPDDTTPTLRGNTFDPGATYEVNYVRTWCLRNLGCR